MDGKTDLRIQRTYKLLTESLMEMLKEKDFDDITVRELCERAMVRPATFYKHFGDKYEFFTFVFSELLNQFHEQSRTSPDQTNPSDYKTAVIEHGLIFVESNKDIITHTLQGASSYILLDLIEDQICRDASATLKSGLSDTSASAPDPDRTAVIMAGALSYTVKWWVLHDCKPGRGELVKDFQKVFGFGADS